MIAVRPLRVLSDERGMAMAMSLIALLALSALVLAFSTLSSSEPVIANNQLRVAAARGIAEAGLERTVWALNPGPESGRLGYDPYAGPLSGTAAAPYNGSSAIPLSLNGTQYGAFRVTVTPWAHPVTGVVDPWRVNVNAVGWTPSDPVASPSDTRTRAHQRITATLMRFRNIAGDARCALCVRGSLEVWGSSVVDSRPAHNDPACGPASRQSRPGTFATGLTNTGGSGRVYGSTQPSTGPNQYNRVGTSLADIGGPYDIITPATPDDPAFQDVFDSFKFKDHELDALRALAKARGTYYQGTVTFNSSNQMPSGIVFVDTVDGQNITASTPVSNFANVDIHGNAGSDSGNTFNGWLIVNGSLSISGNVQMNGLVYATNDISYAGTGTGRIEGQMISANVRDTVATQVIDSTTTGNSLVRMNCAYVRDGGASGMIPQTWALVAGSYKERGD